MLNMSSVVDAFPGISRKYSEQLFYQKNLLMDIPYFIKEYLWMSAFDEATLKKIFGRSKPENKR